MKTILITGATAGIGKATAHKLAQEGHRLIICGRREERLEALSGNLLEAGAPDVLACAFDVGDKPATMAMLGTLPDDWKKIDVLINNAGLAVGLASIHEGETDDWERMIDTNIKGLLYVTRVIAPLMAANEKGHIINIGSIAGKEVYPGGNVYCATKHAVDALTKAMRIELVKHNIRVTQIAPAATETEFSQVRFHGDVDKAKGVYKGFEPLTGEDIADIIAFAISRPAHVNISDLLVTPTAQATATQIVRKP
jgi:3-hydroxy acid dehydrogenase / malonic semialdehyde reductase